MQSESRGIFINNGFMALHGAATVMIGTTLPEMIRRFDLSLARGGLIVSAQSAGALVLVLAAGLALTAASLFAGATTAVIISSHRTRSK